MSQGTINPNSRINEVYGNTNTNNDDIQQNIINDEQYNN